MENGCGVCFKFFNKLEDEKFCRLFSKNFKDINPIHLSVILNNYDAFIKLIEIECCDPNETTKDENSLLHLSCIYGNTVSYINLENFQIFVGFKPLRFE